MDPNEFSWTMHDVAFMPIKTTFGPTHDGSMLKYVKCLTRGRKIHVVQQHLLVKKTDYNAFQDALIVEENQGFDTSLVAIGNEKNVFDLVQVL